MVKRNKNIIILIALFLLISINSIIVAKADSGWDSSYDIGGSSWDYGSSWDSSSSWDSGSSWSGGYYTSSSTVNNPILTIVVALGFIALMIGVSYFSYKVNKKARGPKTIINNIKYEDLDDEKITAVISDFNKEEFKKQAFNIYKDIQTAWMNFDTNTIRNLTTDELYNMYSAQLTTLKVKKQQNIMKNIEYIDAKIVDVTNENDVYTIKVYLNVKCLDYVIDSKTKKTLRCKDDHRLNIEYLLTFVKSSSDDKKVENCPNCGAPVDINASATCPYCNSTLVKVSSDYVLSKKECIGQKME